MARRRKAETPEQVRKRLLDDGWVERKGRGDHLNFNKAGQPMVITLDMGAREVTIGMLRSIYRKAGWQW
jgi:predicted RNA binding protein YcfA (HicA-like mRNA interferase family)